MSKSLHDRTLVLSLMVGLAAVSVAGAQEFTDARKAYAEGGRRLRMKDDDGARAAFEEALRLAPDDAFRVQVYELLTTLYRKLPTHAKMAEACEFVIDRGEQNAKRKIVTRSLVAFLYQRGLIDQAVTEYEASLREDPKHYVALSVLSQTYTLLKREQAERGKELTERLAELDRGRAAELATKHEATARATPATAAWYWKEAAAAWAEADRKEQALAAANNSLGSPPEARSDLLKYYWRDGLGDVFAKLDKPDLAIPQYEAAVAVTTLDPQRKTVEAKIAKLKEGAPKP